MTITTHVCRGNFRSTFISSGGYEPVAQSLLAKCNYDGYFLEYDTDRAGGFEPLRFLPKGNKIVVLGLVTSKSGRGSSRATDIKKRIQEATKFVALDQLVPVAAMRLRLDRGRQRAGRGRAMGEAEDDRGAGEGGVGEIDRSFPRKRESELRPESTGSPPSRGRTDRVRRVNLNVPTHHAAVPRRSCRQPAAHRRR